MCLDERPVVLREDARREVPMKPGRLARRDYEYVRCGTANVFCIVEPLTGRRLTFATADRKRHASRFSGKPASNVLRTDFALRLVAAAYNLANLLPLPARPISNTALPSALTERRKPGKGTIVDQAIFNSAGRNQGDVHGTCDSDVNMALPPTSTRVADVAT